MISCLENEHFLIEFHVAQITLTLAKAKKVKVKIVIKIIFHQFTNIYYHDATFSFVFLIAVFNKQRPVN